MLHASAVTGIPDLEKILSLQQQYLRGRTSANEEKEQGFLTICHDLGTLIQMHELEPSMIVKQEEDLAGYALVMSVACRAIIPMLVPRLTVFDQLHYRGRPLAGFSYYVMGQICVAKAYRGQGVFDLLYEEHRNRLRDKYEFVVTEISTRNTRSLRAHERVGFKPIHTHRDETDEWSVVLWDWS